MKDPGIDFLSFYFPLEISFDYFLFLVIFQTHSKELFDQFLILALFKGKFLPFYKADLLEGGLCGHPEHLERIDLEAEKRHLEQPWRPKRSHLS